MRRAWCLALWIVGSALVRPGLAQGVAEASGTVADRTNAPIEGATVTFWARSNPSVTYTDKSNKKGKYFVGGMFSSVESERWNMKVEAEGWVQAEVRVESRTVNKVLVGDIMTAKLSLKVAAPDVVIKPLGHAQVDWVMARPDEEAGDLEAAIGSGGDTTGKLPEATGGAAGGAGNDPWEQALTLANAGSLEEALPHFDKAIEQQPGNAERHEAYAKVLFRADQQSKAGTEARKATELDPLRTDAWMLLFSIYEQHGDLELAATAIESARKAAPQDLRVLDRQAYLCIRKGDPAGAIAAYTEITRIKPASAEAWAALGNLHAEAGHAQESEQAYGKVVELDPLKAYQTYYNLGVLITNRDSVTPADTRRAADAFRKAVQIKPDYAVAWQQLGYALIAVGDTAGATEALQSYLRVRPDAPDADRVRSMIKTLTK